MAGSLFHAQMGWSMIENMGDAHETVEELLYLVLALTDKADREEALGYFHAVCRGEIDPSHVPEPSPDLATVPGHSDFAKAFIETREAMAK